MLTIDTSWEKEEEEEDDEDEQQAKYRSHSWNWTMWFNKNSTNWIDNDKKTARILI